MTNVAVTGINGYLGQHLLARLDANPEIERVIGIDVGEPLSGSPKLEYHGLDVRDPRLAKVIAGADVVVHLAFQHDPIRDLERMRAINVEGTRDVLEAAAHAGARKVVYPSSVTAYGAHADNDVPMDESAPLRPNADFPYALHKAETEGLMERFRSENAGTIVTVLRSAVALGHSVENFVTRMLESPRLLAVKGYEPPMQFVHELDLADALAFAIVRDIAGAYNVAADGWIGASEVVAATGKKRVELPEAVAFSMAHRLRRAGLTTAPAGELHHLMHPCVVSNAKLRAAGWSPARSNREALDAALDARRPWLALGRARVRKDSLAKGAAATVGAAAAMAVLRRARSRG